MALACARDRTFASAAEELALLFELLLADLAARQALREDVEGTPGGFISALGTPAVRAKMRMIGAVARPADQPQDQGDGPDQGEQHDERK